MGHGAGAVGNNVPTANLKTIKSLDVSNKNIKDLTGIQDFVALTELDCSFNELLSLDVSANKLLTNLSCYSTGLTSLNVSANKLLTNLSCSSNKLKNLDVSKNTALVSLDCGGNQLSTLNLSSNIALEDLSCEGNNLSSLDLSSNKALWYLECSANQLKSLNVSKCAGLSILSCYSNKLEVLNLSANTALRFLECYHNALTSLDLSKNTALTGLECSSNKLITLDIRNGKNDKMTDFAASSNPDLTCIYVNNKAASYLSGWLKDATAKFVTTESECTTSASDFKEQDISMYPNPTNGILNFDFSGKKVQSIKISDVVGRTVFEKNNPNQREAIDLSAFVSGMYMVTLQMDKENRSFKIIKQ